MTIIEKKKMSFDEKRRLALGNAPAPEEKKVETKPRRKTKKK